MNDGNRSALARAVLVAKAACASVGRQVSAGAVGTALALMLSLGGCGQSHVNAPDMDGDGYDRTVDCNDDDPSIHPGATDPDCADGIDQDCDGQDGDPDLICNWFPEDRDGDGWPIGEDCDDSDPATYPGAPEDCCEGIDRDCDGVAEMCTNCFPDGWDNDGDGYFAGGWSTPPDQQDCDDADPSVNPGAEEICYDGVDNDCSGAQDDTPECAVVNPVPDADGDGYTLDVDCDDSNPWIHPDAVEDCWDGVDNDCDGTVDEEPPEGCVLNGMLDFDALDGDAPSKPDEKLV